MSGGQLLTRAERRLHRRLYAKQVNRILSDEVKALESGEWPPWEAGPKPDVQSYGWLADVDRVYHNKVFVVLARNIHVPDVGPVTHLAIRNCSHTDIAWRDKWRIKNELMGNDLAAVEVFPKVADVVNGADLYHLWVFPPGYSLPFGLHIERE